MNNDIKTPASSPAATARRRLTGTVVGAAMQKTVKVRIDRTVLHKKYQKRYTVSRTYLAHNESPEVKVGDKVTIEETRPLSARKRWRVVTLVNGVKTA